MMEWDLQDFGWESSTDLELDPKQDHHDHHNHLVVVDFTKSTTTPQKSTSLSSETNNKASLSCGGASKQQRLVGQTKTSCLVDGCDADLSECRDYHKRHRVCERHSKTPIVFVKGEEKRFCQQCSRFHSLGEFDEVKRSCRKRLDGHNRRRRKSQHETFYLRSKNYLPGYKGSRILQFGNPMWPLETKTGSESWLYDNKSQPNIAGKSTTSTTMMMSSSDEEIPLPIDSGGRALYLLSTAQTLQQPIAENCSFQLLDYNNPNGVKNISNNNNNNNNVCYGLRMGPDSLLEHGTLRMLPVSME